MISLGKFIVVEGLEGAGKTTAIATVAQQLQAYQIHDLVFTREPGGTPLAEALRTLVKDSVDNEPLTYQAELLMLYAARIQLVDNVIKPALKAGKWVIGDRHDLSTQAYQGAGRQLDSALIDMLKNSVLGAFKPDLTLYLDLSPEIGLERAKQRGKLDRIEQESLEFFDRVRTRYQQLAQQDQSIVVINAEQSLEKVTAAIQTALSDWLNG